LQRLMTSQAGNDVTNRLGVAIFLQVVNTWFDRICNRWHAVSAYRFWTLIVLLLLEVERPFSTVSDHVGVRNRVQSIFCTAFRINTP
jgi:hypothetical protein